MSSRHSSVLSRYKEDRDVVVHGGGCWEFIRIELNPLAQNSVKGVLTALYTLVGVVCLVGLIGYYLTPDWLLLDKEIELSRIQASVEITRLNTDAAVRMQELKTREAVTLSSNSLQAQKYQYDRDMHVADAKSERGGLMLSIVKFALILVAVVFCLIYMSPLVLIAIASAVVFMMFNGANLFGFIGA